MKQLLSLVLKYIRRQRFRTTLTFLCILLSVFVFNLLCDTFVVLRGVMIEDIADFSGIWEANLSPAVEKTADTDAAIETIRNSQFVDSYFLQDYSAVYRDNSHRDQNSCLEFLEMSLNGQEPDIISSFSQQYYDGDTDLLGRYSFMTDLPDSSVTKADSSPSLRLPREYQKNGWKIGDKVSVTLRVFTAKLTDDQPALKEKIESRAREYKKMYGEDAKYRIFADSPGELPSLFDMGLLYAVKSRNLTNELVMEETLSAEPYTFTATISGFYSYDGGEPELIARKSDIDISKCMNGAYADHIKEDDAQYDYSINDTGLGCRSMQTILIRTPQNLDFDDTLEAICEELGLSAEQTDDVLHPAEAAEKANVYNQEYLRYKFRGSDAIAGWFTDPDMLISIGVFCGVAILIWALMRFVIDNCFEISVQERSAQFATLRIMGASRRQVSLVVGFEALFYCIAAVPLGTFLSYLCRTSVLNALAEYGFVIREASFPILTVLAVFLALTAILISAYTSSMWAARAYNPLDAAKKTHLKGNKKETIWTKNLFGSTQKPTKQEKKAESKAKPTGNLKHVKVSKLNRKQKSFLRNYTMRNIRRTRSRFLISVISMSLGTMLFAFGLTIGLAIFMEVRDDLSYERGYGYDFAIGVSDSVLNVENTCSELDAYLGNTDIFTNLEHEIRLDTTVDNLTLLEDLKDYLDNVAFRKSNSETPVLLGMTEESYNREYKDTVGMDYQSFLKTGGVLVEDNLCGTLDQWKVDEEGELHPVLLGRAPEYTPVTGKAISVYQFGINGYGGYSDYGNEYGETISYYYDDFGNEITAEDVTSVTVPVTGIFKRESDATNLKIMIPMELFSDQLKDLADTSTNVMYSLTLRTNTDYPEAREKLSEIRDGYEAQNITHWYNDNYAETTGMVALLKTILAIAVIALSAVWLTGIFTMLNTVNTSVLNRAEELAMLRMIGMSRKMMRKTVMLESTIYCIFSTVIGGILGISGSFYMMTGMYFFQGREELVFVILGVVLTSIILANYVISRLAARPSLHTLNRYLASGRMMQ